jgi:hypothetical protein
MPKQMRRLTRGAQIPAPESREALADVLDQLIHHELIQKTLSELPPEVRTVLQEQGPRAFSSHSERVYGTATRIAAAL